MRAGPSGGRSQGAADPFSIRLACALYRFVLRARPNGVDRNLRGEMLQTFRSLCLHRLRERSALSVLMLAAGESIDVVRSGRRPIRRRRDGEAAPTGVGRSSSGRRPGAARRLEELVQDLRFALRTLARRPLLTGAAAGTLAIGMALVTAVFSVTNALFVRPLPLIAEPSSLVEVYHDAGERLIGGDFPIVPFLREQSASLSDVAGFHAVTVSLRTGSEVTVTSGLQVTGNYFNVLGVEPSVGRFFAIEESFYPDVADEVVISHALWQSRFAGNPDVLGRQIAIQDYRVRIIGVAPEGFGGHEVLQQRDLFIPMGLPLPGRPGPEEMRAVGAAFTLLIGRLADGVSLLAARDELTALGAQFYRGHSIEDPWPLRVELYGGVPVNDRATLARFFLLLMIIAAMVLVIACVNVANMLLARATERRREIAIRASLGAGRARLARQLLTESVLLFLLAGMMALLVTAWSMNALVAWYLPDLASVRLQLDAAPDARVFGLVLLVAALTGISFGLIPALAATRSSARASLRASATRAGRSRASSILVGAQAAVALTLLVAAGLLVRSLDAARAVDLGFDVEGVYVVQLDLELAGHDPAASAPFYARLLERVRRIPGVTAAASARWSPLAGISVSPVVFTEDAGELAGERMRIAFDRVSDDYFATAGIPLLAGRGFTTEDDAGAPRVAVVNATMAGRFWPAESAVGKRFRTLGGEHEVVGVAADAKYDEIFGETPSYFYVAAAQRPHTAAALRVRAADLAGTAAAIRREVAALDPGVPVVEITAVESIVARFLAGRRMAAAVAVIAGIVGLLLGAAGMYAVAAFAAAQRRHEIGVRMALGARVVDVLALMLANGMRAPLIGMGLGTLAAAAAARALGSILYEVSPLDPWTYGGVLITVGTAAAAATLIPARRAARVSPVETLRSE